MCIVYKIAMSLCSVKIIIFVVHPQTDSCYNNTHVYWMRSELTVHYYQHLVFITLVITQVAQFLVKHTRFADMLLLFVIIRYSNIVMPLLNHWIVNSETGSFSLFTRICRYFMFEKSPVSIVLKTPRIIFYKHLTVRRFVFSGSLNLSEMGPFSKFVIQLNFNDYQ